MKKSILAFLCAFTLVSDVYSLPIQSYSQPSKDFVRVGTWNVKRLGHGKKRYDLVAKQIEENFDVVAVQEVMNPTGVEELIKKLPGWSAAVTPEVGKKGYFERYAVLTRDSIAKLNSIKIVEDKNGSWTRAPMLACVAASKVDFCLLSNHIVFGDNVEDRDKEIEALAPLAAGIRDSGKEKDIIVVGDFNRAGNTPGFKSFQKFGFRLGDAGDLKTSLGSNEYASAYDHVVLDPRYTKEWLGSVKRIDMVTEVCTGNFKFCSTEVSDHAPVMFVLDNKQADDD